MMPNCQEFMIDFGFDHIRQIFKKFETLCVGQLARAEKKSRK